MELFARWQVIGADEVIAAARDSGKFDYDAKLEGLLALDRYTLQLKLKHPDYILLEFMTSTVMAAVAREVVEAYGSPENGWTMDHPVGTGPFKLKERKRGSKVILAANPGYRDERFPSAVDSSVDASVRANAGKRLPLVGQVEVNIIEESNPLLLAFEAQQIDYLHLPYNLVDRVIPNGTLKTEYARRGVKWTRVLESAFTYTYFNMDDPVVGGYTPEKAPGGARLSRLQGSQRFQPYYEAYSLQFWLKRADTALGHDLILRRVLFDGKCG